MLLLSACAWPSVHTRNREMLREKRGSERHTHSLLDRPILVLLQPDISVEFPMRRGKRCSFGTAAKAIHTYRYLGSRKMFSIESWVENLPGMSMKCWDQYYHFALSYARGRSRQELGRNLWQMRQTLVLPRHGSNAIKSVLDIAARLHVQANDKREGAENAAIQSIVSAGHFEEGG